MTPSTKQEAEPFDIASHLANLSDDEIIAQARTAHDDLAEAARTQRDSEWHEACFAGVMVFALELNKRGLSLAIKH